MNKELDILSRYSRPTDIGQHNLDSRYYEGTMCYRDVNLIRDALEKSQTDEKIQTNS